MIGATVVLPPKYGTGGFTRASLPGPSPAAAAAPPARRSAAPVVPGPRGARAAGVRWAAGRNARRAGRRGGRRGSRGTDQQVEQAVLLHRQVGDGFEDAAPPGQRERRAVGATLVLT